MEKQTTIEKSVSYSGIGLHTGNETTLWFKPAPPNTGSLFVRSDLPHCPSLRADIKNVVDVAWGTTIANHEMKIYTVEHVLAAQWGLGIDNLIIELNSNEPPVGDGSCLPFVETLNKAGIKEQDSPRHLYRVKEPFTVYDSQRDATVVVLPDDELRLSYTIYYPQLFVKSQFKSLAITPSIFLEEICQARTFCFLKDVESLKELGLIKGGSLDNAVVIGEERILNEGLRYEDEFVRHKILDLIGDLALLGTPIKGHIIALKSGHASHIKLVGRLRQQMEKSRASALGAPYAQSLPTYRGEPLEVEEIKKFLPHRFPFLLVDRISHLEANKCAVGIKNVSINEPFFQGHFPQRAIMPGVLVIEVMAQIGGILLLSKEENRGKYAYFMGIDKAKFRKPVFPGDQLVCEVEMSKMKSRTGKVVGKAMVDGHVVAEAELLFAIVD